MMQYSVKRQGNYTSVRIDFGNSTVYRGLLDDKELSMLCSTLFDIVTDIESAQGEYEDETSSQ